MTARDLKGHAALGGRNTTNESMPRNPDYGHVLYDLLSKAQDGDGALLDAYVAAEPTRAVSEDRRCLLAVRHQYGTLREGRWYGYSAQPDTNPWPGSPTRTALVLLRSEAGGRTSWHELTLPAARGDAGELDFAAACSGSLRSLATLDELALSLVSPVAALAPRK